MDGTLTVPAVVALLCATADRTPDAAAGAHALAHELAARNETTPRLIGSPPDGARTTQWPDDLAENRGCLLEAGGQVEDALSAGERPVLLAGDCSIGLTTLTTVLRLRPDAMVVWLDAHPDFNTPDSTISGYLGGMALAGACGQWDPSLVSDPPVSPARVILCGARSFDDGERERVQTSGVARIDRPSLLGEALHDRPVYIHLDVDVLADDIVPSGWPEPGGMSDGELRVLLADVATAASEIIGVEVTGLQSPKHAPLVADILAPLLAGGAG